MPRIDPLQNRFFEEMIRMWRLATRTKNTEEEIISPDDLVSGGKTEFGRAPRRDFNSNFGWPRRGRVVVYSGNHYSNVGNVAVALFVVLVSLSDSPPW